ncbi:hypothetical protein DCAR_0730216 [Daucus carota subsp. sativus]|uniref:F-box domain-containing protein n=1 Tax=Daucus carota subsp. sativus TaxID=79200 RepID=A0A161ZNY9_DAUCS|nr:PREDICTED: F-box/kelch-repeat protein At1g15670-like [Daucus carota subsp. sativus]WOH10746.1 hypothetical protein DCAR_0730216 [Daucus carota subsp. sativus]
MLMDLISGLNNDVGRECLIRLPYDTFCSATSVCKTWKAEVELPEFWRRRRDAGMTQRLIVMTQARVDPTRKRGGVKNSGVPAYRLTVCEPGSVSWTELPLLPGHLNGLPMFCQLAAVGLNLVVMGGLDPVTWDASTEVFVYNFVSATWKRGANMPGCPRSFFACASDSRMVFVAGGHDCEKNALKSAMVYDVADDKWVPLPDMASERDECKGVFHLGKFHVIGGYPTESQGRFGRSAEAFDVATWQWDEVCENFLEAATCPRSYVDNGEGNVYKWSSSSGEIMMTNDSATWQVVAELPSEVLTSTHMTAWQEKLMVIGSHRFGEPHKVYTLDLKNRKWTKVAAPEEYSGHVQSSCLLEI